MNVCGRRGFTMVEVLVAIAIVGGMVAMAMPALMQSREASRAVVCRQNLRQIGMAAHLFHETNRAFPPARIAPRPGDVPQHACGGQEPTWFVHLLPFLEQSAAFSRWNVLDHFAAHPDALRSLTVSTYVCPSRRSVADAASGARPSFTAAAIGAGPGSVMLALCPLCGGGPISPPSSPVDPDPGSPSSPPGDADPTPAPPYVAGALGDYAGNHGDMSPGAAGKSTDFFFGGNGTGVLITSRALCAGGRPATWVDRIRITDITDGTSSTFLAGERHLPAARIGTWPDDGSVYDGRVLEFASRLAGPGVRLGRGPNDVAAGPYAFGSWHQEACHFVMADGSVRGMSHQTNTTVLERLSNRHDGSPVMDH
jgi:prepilin-type N-terminal cleavage/methylation domain-containing protein